jgi:hypothetical protein
MSQALQAGPVRRRRAMMGLLDADGWGWASVKALGWFVLLILLLAYIPDRVYYFTVNRTIDVGLLAWSPVNFCPPANKTLPCPAPAGSVIPWEPAPAELSLPAPRTNGSLAQVGTNLVYVGGSDGTAATTTTFTTSIAKANFGKWAAGPALPEARMDAAVVTLGSTIYLIGGAGPDGKPVDTVWSLAFDQEARTFGSWTPVKDLVLPAARSGAAAIPVSDGMLVAGGVGPDGAPSTVVWKATSDPKGVLGAFSEQAPLLDGVSHATMAQVGDYVWIWGGRDANGPSGEVQRGALGTPPSTATPGPNPVVAPLQLSQWAVTNAYNLPAPRSAAAGFSANGGLYLAGGSDATGPKNQLYWTVPSGTGTLPGWKHLDQTDLPAAGLDGASAAVNGSHVFVIGGTTADGVQAGAIRADLAPQEPFFQAGLVGVVIPALTIPGEIGQQLGYLNAFTVGLVDFALMLFVGWAYAHPAAIRGWVDRRRKRRA